MRHLGNIEFASNDDRMQLKAFIMDIHEQFVKEEEMRYSNTRYSLINAAMTEAPWDMEVDQSAESPMTARNNFWWSEQYRHMLGFRDEE